MDCGLIVLVDRKRPYPDVVRLVKDLWRKRRLLLLLLLLLAVRVVAHEDPLIDSSRVRDVDGFVGDVLRLEGPQDVVLLLLHLSGKNRDLDGCYRQVNSCISVGEEQ